MVSFSLPCSSWPAKQNVGQHVFVSSSGATFEETCCITPGFKNVIPVRSSQGSMSLLDLSAPFLFRGKQQYYGSDPSPFTSTQPVAPLWQISELTAGFAVLNTTLVWLLCCRCKQCSHVDLTQPFGQNTDVLDEKAVAEGNILRTYPFTSLTVGFRRLLYYIRSVSYQVSSINQSLFIKHN